MDLSILIYLSRYRFSIATEQNYYNTLYTECKAFLVILAPQRGLEPRTNWLTANYSTTELLGNKLVPRDRIELPTPDYKTGVIPLN